MNRRKKSLGRRALGFVLFAVLLPIILLLAVFGVVLHTLNRMAVYLLVWVCWVPKGKDVLYVSSDSPIWREYMENEILPLVETRAVVLGWSGRQDWPKWSFAVRVFRTFGGGRNFNPMVVLFRPLRRARIFRFLPAFMKWKHGDPTGVEQMRRDLLQALQAFN